MFRRIPGRTDSRHRHVVTLRNDQKLFSSSFPKSASGVDFASRERDRNLPLASQDVSCLPFQGLIAGRTGPDRGPALGAADEPSATVPDLPTTRIRCDGVMLAAPAMLADARPAGDAQASDRSGLAADQDGLAEGLRLGLSQRPVQTKGLTRSRQASQYSLETTLRITPRQ